jgi:DeoR/GlpR family transcriptional regulator of sugar metabolism
MMKTTRHTQIRNLVNQNGQITVTELNAMLDVSEATIRRDLEEMDQLGWVRRTHGGAVRVERAEKEPPIFHRQKAEGDEKQRIAQAAAALIQPGQTVFLGSGSTVSAIVPHIQDMPLTVISNSLPVINQLTSHENIELIVIGGQLRQSELSMVGHVAEQAIREFRADLVFMGMRAIDAEHGFTSDYVAEAMTDRAILKIAPRCVVVADHTKFGRVSTVFLASVTSVHTIISDDQLQPEIAAELQEKALELILV